MKLAVAGAAVVTGGASGLGLSAARALAAQGIRVALFDMNVERGEAAAREIRGCFCHVNVTDEQSVVDGFARARAAHGQERILVHCAGGGGRSAKIVSRDRNTGAIRRQLTADFTATIELNLVGTFRCDAIAATGMLTLEPLEDGERAVIINTASIAASEGQIGQAAYSSSKGGVVSLTLTLARDLCAEGIRVNTIMPGVFATPLMQAAPEAVLSGLAQSVPFPKRLGNPEEFASLVLEIVRNTYFNGEAIRLDGALRMAPR